MQQLDGVNYNWMQQQVSFSQTLLQEKKVGHRKVHYILLHLHKNIQN